MNIDAQNPKRYRNVEDTAPWLDGGRRAEGSACSSGVAATERKPPTDDDQRKIHDKEDDLKDWGPQAGEEDDDDDEEDIADVVADAQVMSYKRRQGERNVQDTPSLAEIGRRMKGLFRCLDKNCEKKRLEVFERRQKVWRDLSTEELSVELCSL